MKNKIKKIKILRIITTLNPINGGPQASIAKSTNVLCEAGFSVDILTNDKKNYLLKKNCKFKVIKLRLDPRPYNFSFKIINWIKKNKKNYDFFIIHGLWEFNSLLARIYIKKNYFIISHGQLDPYFGTELIKKIKKKIYWNLIERQNLINSSGIMVSGRSEVKMLKNTFVSTKNLNIINIGYSNNLVKIAFESIKDNIKFFIKFPKLKNKKFILFLGRINRKKGLDILLDSILNVKDLKNYYFLIAGFSNYENEYEKKLLDKIKNHKKLQERIFCSGFLKDELKISALSCCAATILPSRGENFGVSVVESLYFSKPPLITNKVGIYHEIQKYNAGLISDLNKISITKMIQKFINIDQKSLIRFKKNSKKCYNDIFDIKEENNKLINLLKQNVVKN